MPDLHATEEELILHFYGEPADDSRVADHVSRCGHCRVALDERLERVSVTAAHLGDGASVALVHP